MDDEMFQAQELLKVLEVLERIAKKTELLLLQVEASESASSSPFNVPRGRRQPGTQQL